MQRLEGLLRKAVQDYEMIAPGDRVCVGVSGGKDSVALTVALGHLRRYLGVPFEVMAVTLDPRFGGVEADYQPLADLFAQEGIPYEIRRTDIGPVVFDYRKEPNPCALCAKMRRGALHAAAQELDCNKVALGHHLDDAVETFYMNLWREGRIGCFSPVTYLDQRNITLIRPMIFATESEVKSAVYHAGLPIIKSRCPADGATVREQTKLFVQQMSRDDPAFRQKTLHALQQSGIDGWRPLHTGHTRARFPVVFCIEMGWIAMTNELYEKHCWALVDLDAMQSNLALIQKTVGAPVCCVVKADAYGHGAAVAGPWLEENGAAAFAVSCLAEARHLRRHGISKPILILGYTDPLQVDQLAFNCITQTVYSEEYAKALSAAAQTPAWRYTATLRLIPVWDALGSACVLTLRRQSLPWSAAPPCPSCTSAVFSSILPWQTAPRRKTKPTPKPSTPCLSAPCSGCRRTALPCTPSTAPTLPHKCATRNGTTA